MVEITDLAKDKLKEVLDENPGKYLRIVMQGIGWGGPRLGLALDEPNENEDTTQINGVDVLISDAVKAFADRNTIDYVNLPGGEGFIIAPAGQTYCWYSLSGQVNGVGKRWSDNVKQGSLVNPDPLFFNSAHVSGYHRWQ